MNNPNPFVPQGSLLEQQSKSRSRMKLAVLCVVAVSAAGLMAMLIQGCKREQSTDNTDNSQSMSDTNLPTVDTNVPTMEASNPPVPPTVGQTAAGQPPVATLPAPPPVMPVAPPPVVAPESTGAEYIIVKGDTLAKIAKKNGVSVRALEAANPSVQPSKLKIGQKLALPAGSTGGSAAAPSMSETGMSDTGAETYTVKSGDTLTKIAKSHGVTVKGLEAENGLSTTKIKVGQKLKIPASAAAAPAPAPAPVEPAAPAPVTLPAPVPASAPAPAPATTK